MTLTQGEIDGEEYALWRMVDIRWFGGRVGVLIRSYPDCIYRCLTKKEDKEALHLLQTLESDCLEMSERIKQIDLALLDNRFPLDVLRTLVEKGPDALMSTAGETRKSLEDGNLTAEVVAAIRSKTDFLLDLMKRMEKNDRYYAYRLRISEDERR